MWNGVVFLIEHKNLLVFLPCKLPKFPAFIPLLSVCILSSFSSGSLFRGTLPSLSYVVCVVYIAWALVSHFLAPRLYDDVELNLVIGDWLE